MTRYSRLLHSVFTPLVLVSSSSSAQDSVLARVGDRAVRLVDYERASHHNPAGFDLSTLDGRRALLFELINKEILEISALERYPETPAILARAMKGFRESERRRMVLAVLDPSSTRPGAVLDSLRVAVGLNFHAEGLEILRSLYVWTPTTDDPLEYLKVSREKPIPTPEEARVPAVEYQLVEDWTVGDVVDRMMELPIGVWPRGDSVEQVESVLNMLIRDFLLDKAAADLEVESDPEFVSRMQRRDLNMRIKLFYHQDIIGDLKSPTPEEVHAYFVENRQRYVTPGEYRVESFTSTSPPALDRLRGEWQSGVEPAVIMARHTEPGSVLHWDGVHTWREGERPEMDAALSDLEPGDVSSITVDDQGAHVFRVMEKTAARELRFEDVQGDVAKELTALRQDERLNEFLAQKRNALGVVIEEDRLRTLPWPDPSDDQRSPPPNRQHLQRLHLAE